MINNLIDKSDKIKNKTEAKNIINNTTVTRPLLYKWAAGISLSPVDLFNKYKSFIAKKALEIIFKHVWSPRSATANTSPSSGIQWRKSITSTQQQPAQEKILPSTDLLLNCFSKTNPINIFDSAINTYINEIYQINSILPTLSSTVHG